MKSQRPHHLFFVLISLLWASVAFAMPPRPDLLEEFKDKPRSELPLELTRLGARGFPPKPRLMLPDTVMCLVILIDFEDGHADTLAHSVEHFDELLFSCENGRSMRSYYLSNSYGKLDIVGDVKGWFRLPQPLAFYADERRGMGYYPHNAQKMVEDAVVAADPYVDFSLYDNDGPDGIPSSGDDDGYVDFLLVVHGGSGYEWTLNPSDIHSHAGTIRPLEADGVKVRTYATEPEDGNIGTFAHEFGHLLGLPDLYDPTLSTFGLGMWSLMAYGSWGGGDGSRPVGLDAWSKVRLGFVEPVVIDTNFTAYELPNVEDSAVVLKLWNGGEEGAQYFLVENRRAVGCDSYLGRFGEGLLIYHVDERYDGNSSPTGHLVSLEQADGRFDLERRRVFGFGSDSGDPYPGSTGNRSFGWWTTPSNYSNEGSPTQVTILNISDPGDLMKFDVGVTSPVVLLEDYSVDDSRGDGDGRPEAGEDIDILVRLHNYGAKCESLRVELGCDDSGIDIYEDKASIPLIGSQEISQPVRFAARIGESVLEPYQFGFSLEMAGRFAFGTYEYSDNFIFTVPLHLLEGFPVETNGGIVAPLAASDIDNDGLKEIIAATQNGYVYLWRADGSQLDGWPVHIGHPIHSKPAVCDLDVDGKREIIVTTVSGLVYVLRSDGTLEEGWPQQMGSEVRSDAVLADIDDDGLVEVICADVYGEVSAWNEDGMAADGWPKHLNEKIWMSAAAADVDGDYVPEIVIGGYGGKLYVLEGDGSIADGWPVSVGRGCGRGSPSIADFDADGKLEIAVSGLFSNSTYVVELDGTIHEGWPRWSFNCSELSSPVPVDLDSDGVPEIAVSTSCGTIVAWNGDGSICKVIQGTAPDPMHNCEPIFCDLDGNGTIEAIGTTDGKTRGEVYAFGASGIVGGFPLNAGRGIRSTPLVCDLDDDGNFEIAAATTGGKLSIWRFAGAKGAGRKEYAEARGNTWNTGQYGFEAKENMPMADLVVYANDIEVDPSQPLQNQVAKIKARISNVGHADAHNFYVNAYFDTIGESSLIDSLYLDQLSAKTDTFVTFDWQVPPGVPTRLIHVLVDTQDSVPERLELNNHASRRVYLSLADLELEFAGIDPFPVAIGDSVEITLKLTNKGDDVANNFVVSLYDSVVDDARKIAEFTIVSLGIGETSQVVAHYLIPRFRDDSVRLWGVCDKEHNVVEYYRSNNVVEIGVPSGVKGESVEFPYHLSLDRCVASRHLIAAQSPSCNCVFAARMDGSQDFVFESPGLDIDICRNTLVFSSGGDIAGFDLSDSMLLVVSSDELYESQPTVWADNYAWVAQGSDSTYLFLRSSEARVDTIRVTSGSIAHPDISSELLIWQERYGLDWDIMAFDLGVRTIFPIAQTEDDEINPCVWGETVVWEDRKADESDIIAYDVTSGTRYNVCCASGIQEQPSIFGDIIVWQDSRNGNWDIYGYSVSEAREFPVIRQIDDQIKPFIAESTIVWIDKRGESDEIRGLVIGGRRNVATVNRFEALWQDGRIVLVANIAEHDDGIVYRIYRYPDARPLSEDRFSHLRYEFSLGGDSIHVFADTLVAPERSYFYTLGVVDAYGEESFHGPVEGKAYRSSPRRFVIGMPHPNPFRSSTTIAFGLPRRASYLDNTSWPDPSSDVRFVELAIYSVRGRLVRRLERGELKPGYYTFTWDGKDDRGNLASPGVYFVTVSTPESVTSRKTVYLR